MADVFGLIKDSNVRSQCYQADLIAHRPTD
jgi:hypothetical protein